MILKAALDRLPRPENALNIAFHHAFYAYLPGEYTTPPLARASRLNAPPERTIGCAQLRFLG